MTKTETTVNSFSSQQVKNLELNVGYAQVIFDTTPDKIIQITAENIPSDAYVCEMRNDTLVVSYKPLCRIPHLPYHEPQITFLLPESLILEHVSLNLGAGEINIEQVPLTCDTMDVTIGAGKWKMIQLSVMKKLHIEVGAGSINLKRAKSGSLYLECGAGDCFYNGKIDNNFQINCGVGSCELQLENKEQDFDYDISCALGEIKMNGNRLKSCSSTNLRFQNDTLHKAILQCGVGKITLKTA